MSEGWNDSTLYTVTTQEVHVIKSNNKQIRFYNDMLSRLLTGRASIPKDVKQVSKILQ